MIKIGIKNNDAFEGLSLSSKNQINLTADVIMGEVAKFSDKTFGKDRPYTAPLYHLKKEVEEIFESNGNIMEYADTLLLLLDSFRKRYPDLSATALLASCLVKLDICRNRKWGKPDKNGVVEHIKQKKNG